MRSATLRYSTACSKTRLIPLFEYATELNSRWIESRDWPKIVWSRPGTTSRRIGSNTGSQLTICNSDRLTECLSQKVTRYKRVTRSFQEVRLPSALSRSEAQLRNPSQTARHPSLASGFSASFGRMASPTR